MTDLHCQELVEVVTDYLEGAIAPGGRIAVDQHLLICEGCTNYVSQFRAAIALAGRLEQPVEPNTTTRLLQAFRNRSVS
jgi:hypothetical protein